MQYQITVTTPAGKTVFTEWNYYEMVTRRFHALQGLHDHGFTFDILGKPLEHITGHDSQNNLATIVTTKG